LKETIGILAGVLITVSVIPYALRTYQRKITPNLVSWSIWALLGLAILLTYKSSGATSNVWPAVFGFTNPLLISVLLIWKGKREKPDAIETACVIVGVLSIAIWWFVKDSRYLSQYALYVALLADACAAIPTIKFVWTSPDKDRPFAWVVYSIGYGLGMLAIEEHTFANYVLPVYMCLGSASVAVPLVAYRIRHRLPVSEWI
jgi:hypothetical protein